MASVMKPTPALDVVLTALEPLGALVLRPPERPVTGAIVLYDHDDPPAIGAGDVVLGVGVPESDLSALLGDAAAAGAALVVGKTGGDGAAPCARELPAGSPGLILVPRGADWASVTSLVRSAAASPAGMHDELLVTGGDALAAAISAVVGAPVTLEDPYSRLIGHSEHPREIDAGRRETILRRRTPDTALRRLTRTGVLGQLAKGEGPILVPADEPGELPRLAMPIHVGDELLGTLWAAFPDEPGDVERETVSRVAAAVALQLLEDRTLRDARRRVEAHLMRQLLFGAGDREGAASRLGVAGRGFRVLVASAGAGAQARVEQARVCASTHLRLQLATGGASASADIDGVLYTILCLGADAADSRRAAERLAGRVLERCQGRIPPSTVLGIGRHVGTLDELPASRSSAEEVLRVMRERGDASAHAVHEDVRGHARLLRYADAVGADAHDDGPVQRLAAYDAANGTAYLETIRAYLAAFGDTTVAGGALHVHPATVRYRMRRVGSIAGVDLGDPSERLALELELFVRNRAAHRR